MWDQTGEPIHDRRPGPLESGVKTGESRLTMNAVQTSVLERQNVDWDQNIVWGDNTV